MKRKKLKKCCGAKLHAKHKIICFRAARLRKVVMIEARKSKSEELKPGDLVISKEFTRGAPIKPAPLMSYLEDESITPKEFRRAANEFFKDAIIALDFIVLFSFLALIGVGIILFT